MPTPSIQTLVTDAQQILNLDSISAVRSVVAVALANANTGTPLNPNLTTQQLWNEFYQVVNKPKSDIESIIANQLMKLLYAPPAPGGAGANKQVIFNDGGVLAGDVGFTYDKATDALKIAGLLGIGGDGISPLTVYAAASAKATAMLLTTVGSPTYGWDFSVDGAVNGNLFIRSLVAGTKTDVLEFDRANGNVGVGRTPAAYKFEVLGNAQIIQSNFLDVALRISQGPATTGNVGQILFTDSSGTIGSITSYGSAYGGGVSGALAIGVGGANRLTIDTSGNALLATGNIALGTSGKGIDFSATPSGSGTMTSELLNDYEEGTFTPEIQGSTTAGTATYTGRYGRYTKIGRLVTVNIYIDWNSHTGTGDTRVAGLPFTNGSTFSAATIGYANAIAVAAGNMIAAYVDASQPWILLNQIPTGGGANSTVPIDPVGTLVISASYVL